MTFFLFSFFASTVKHISVCFILSRKCWSLVFLLYGYLLLEKNRSALFCTLCSINVRDVEAYWVGTADQLNMVGITAFTRCSFCLFKRCQNLYKLVTTALPCAPVGHCVQVWGKPGLYRSGGSPSYTGLGKARSIQFWGKPVLYRPGGSP